MLRYVSPHPDDNYKAISVVHPEEAQDEGEEAEMGKWSHWLRTRSHAVGRSTCRSLVPHSNTGDANEVLPL
jgi:hypothetical protein